MRELTKEEVELCGKCVQVHLLTHKFKYLDISAVQYLLNSINTALIYGVTHKCDNNKLDAMGNLSKYLRECLEIRRSRKKKSKKKS